MSTIVGEVHRSAAAGLISAVALGALLLSALVVAPVAFHASVDNPALAGRIAGRVFEQTYFLTGLCAAISWLIAPRLRRGSMALTLTCVVLCALMLFVVAPAISRHGDGLPISFAVLHGIASVLHMVLTSLTGWLSWMFIRGSQFLRRED